MQTTEMIARYLKAIEFWLPRGQKADILAEISEDLHSQIDEREAGLGRALNDAELEALLKQRGRPMLVANRYRLLQSSVPASEQALIGPMWFPTYVAVMKVIAFGYVPLWLAVYTVIRRLQHPEESWAKTIFNGTLPTGWTVLFLAAAVVTLLFAIAQFAEARTHFLEDWNPRELPAVRDPHRIQRWSSTIDLIANIAFVLAWVVYASTPILIDGPKLKLTMTPMWMIYFWGFLANGLFKIALAGVNLWRPYQTELRAVCRLAINLSGGALFCWFLKANFIASIYIANKDAAQTQAIKNAIQLVMARCLPLAVILVAVILAVDLFRIVRVRRRDGMGLLKGIAA